MAEVIGAVMVEHGHTQRTFGELVGEKQQTISKWITGDSVPTIEDVYNIEDKLKMSHGTILRRAGYVDDEGSPLDAIDADTALAIEDRATLRRIYKMMRSSYG